MKKRHKGYFNEERKVKDRKTSYGHKTYGTHRHLMHCNKIYRYGKNTSKIKTKIRWRLLTRVS